MWFAVQEKNTDAWDYGSSDYDTACEMLKEQGCGLIAVIENDCCIAEYPYSELVCGMTREELEKAVLDIVLYDMEIVFEFSEQEIMDALKAAKDEDLIEYLQEVQA